MRPYWKGYLKLALVSCPIALHAACSTGDRIAFRQVNKATGNRLRQQLIDEETREPVAPEHKGRGYEVAKGQYLIVEEDELEAIEIESTHVIEIDCFVPRQQIDQRFFHTPYYVAPNEPVAQEAFAVIREAMRHKTMIALGRLVLSKRERVIALEPYGKGLPPSIPTTQRRHRGGVANGQDGPALRCIRSLLRIKELHDTAQLKAAQLQRQTEQLSSWNRSLEERSQRLAANSIKSDRDRGCAATDVP